MAIYQWRYINGDRPILLDHSIVQPTMPRFNPYTLQLQITRMFEDGQSFFAVNKVQDWLRERKEDPNDYSISFHEHPAPPDSGLVKVIEIELQRNDGQPVEDWLQAELNQLSSS